MSDKIGGPIKPAVFHEPKLRVKAAKGGVPEQLKCMLIGRDEGCDQPKKLVIAEKPSEMAEIVAAPQDSVGPASANAVYQELLGNISKSKVEHPIIARREEELETSETRTVTEDKVAIFVKHEKTVAKHEKAAAKKPVPAKLHLRLEPRHIEAVDVKASEKTRDPKVQLLLIVAGVTGYNRDQVDTAYYKVSNFTGRIEITRLAVRLKNGLNISEEKLAKIKADFQKWLNS